MLLITALVAYTGADADTYPSRPLRLLLPFAAGGTVDIMARPIAAKLHELLGKPVIVDNRSSAGGLLATELTAPAAPDGYTLSMASSSALFIAPAYYKKVNYDSLKDFTPTSLVAQQPLLIVANAALPVRNVKELITYAYADVAQYGNYKLDPRMVKAGMHKPGDAEIASLCAQILAKIKQKPLYYAEVIEAFPDAPQQAITRAFGKLHAEQKLWQDAEGRMCVRGSTFAAVLPMRR